MIEKKSYQELKNELDEVLDELQDSDGDIDHAVELHKKGEALLGQLKSYLQQSKNKVEKTRQTQ